MKYKNPREKVKSRKKRTHEEGIFIILYYLFRIMWQCMAIVNVFVSVFLFFADSALDLFVCLASIIFAFCWIFLLFHTSKRKKKRIHTEAKSFFFSIFHTEESFIEGIIENILK